MRNTNLSRAQKRAVKTARRKNKGPNEPLSKGSNRVGGTVASIFGITSFSSMPAAKDIGNHTCRNKKTNRQKYSDKAKYRRARKRAKA